ncbi:hypothetical protein ACT7C2_13705 [Bacillus pacificus]
MFDNIDADEIELHIHSGGGGDAFEGIAICNYLRSHKATVTAYVDGLLSCCFFNHDGSWTKLLVPSNNN